MAEHDRVSELLEFIGYDLSRDEAAQLLKIQNNDLQQAATKFYDAGPANIRKLLNDSVARWDETAFGAGRYGEEDASNNVPTFNIDYAPGYDHYPHSGVQSKAPTRPPSRTSQRSGLSTHFGDAPVQSIENLQESGLIGNSEPVFGPAKQSHYDTAQWAMVPTSTAIIPDPIPSERQREEGQPAILKPSPRFNYLPALIAILHSIPLFRNALLAPEITQRSYWVGDEWWKGNPAIPARVVDASSGMDQAHALDIIHEAQRLMAFLDESDRAYATVGSLLELDAWKDGVSPPDDEDDDLLKFLMLWSNAYSSQFPDVTLNGSLRSVVNIGEQLVENLVLDATVFRESSRSNMDLYDVLDDCLFTSETGSAHIAEISKVLIFRLTSSRTDAKDLGCRIPGTLYVDRYLEANKPVIDSMYREMKQYEEEIREIDTSIQKLKYHTPQKAGAKQLDTLKLLKTSMKSLEAQEGVESIDSSKDAAVLTQLQALHSSIESKITTLDEQTKRIRETLTTISSRFKPTMDDGTTDTVMDESTMTYPEGQTPQDAMHHAYHLRGVATNLGVVYLLHPDTTSNTPGAQQWWRMQYDTESASPTIRRDRLTPDEVIERASTEHASALLIYAHPDATSEIPALLPKPLHDFVKKDGLNFMEELQQATTGWEAMDYDNTADVQQSEWNGHNSPDYDYDWASMSAQQFHRSEAARASAGGGELSSATLTPNTDVDDGPGNDSAGGVKEMVEVNGGMDALVGLAGSSPLSQRHASAPPDVDKYSRSSATVEPMSDVRMEEPKIQHVEVVEEEKRKGG